MIIRDMLAAHPDAEEWRKSIASWPRLAIVIPYRAREEHLRKLLPHLISFFRRNTRIIPLIVVSEQSDDRKFNRGFCKNAGFLAVESNCDYLCFHDVDYLPIWADYAYSTSPTRIIWWGMHLRPLYSGGKENLWLKASRETFGAVVLIDKDKFVQANGYSNSYFGWGFEDDDFKARLESIGLQIEMRDGTFKALDHDHEGFLRKDRKSEDYLRNEALFKCRTTDYQASPEFVEGLSTISLQKADVTFERWHGFDRSESLIVCRLRSSQAVGEG